MVSLPLDIWTSDDEPRLGVVLDEIWTLLEEGVTDRRHGFHTPVAATMRASSGAELRTVVLRDVDREARCLRFHTDIRSKKVCDLKEDPRLSLLFYDRGAQTQIRISAAAIINHNDGTAAQAWKKLSPDCRREYLASEQPGEPSAWPTSGLSPDLQDRDLTLAETEKGYRDFAVVSASFDHLEWLYACHEGHRRAKFEWLANGELETTWLVP
jgi:hypothetical protein